MDASASLQIPDWSQPGPSSSRAPSRPASAAVPAMPMSPPSSKKRASHSVTTSHNQQHDETPSYRDVYAHPAAIAFATAHPRRTIPKFGPYLLLQTLGEGEFGKVKLGLHGQWGEEVAVKLIRRGSVDNSVRMSKVEREIEVLRTIKHPNIVRLYDVIETDKYIGIILEYASGGELFDHILAHRYLKEKDACKLFAQLVSGVSYIHAKKIVHRDLKLENLLLDRNRNVIITDFGFANRFEHRPDDLMQTSCGSPCYAAPELVISEGLYVGSAVDIWSCGVILYAMLAGYLPFDDDPANPDGDNINLLYKYIVNTPLTFPDYVSPDARDLLSMMLVPDPKRRSGLPDIMGHRWLAPYRHLFDRSVAELERLTLEQQNMKRQAYQRQMRSHAQEQLAQREREQTKMARSQTQRDMPPPPPPPSNQFIYESSAPDLSTPPPRRAVASAIVVGSSSPDQDDVFAAPSPSALITVSPDDVDVQGMARGEPPSMRSKSKESARSKRSPKDKPSSAAKSPDKDVSGSRRKKQGGYRHTIQLEYDDEGSQGKPAQNQAQTQLPPRTPQVDIDMVHVSDAIPPSPRRLPELPTDVSVGSPTTPHSTRRSPAIPPASPSPYLARSSTEPATIHMQSPSTPIMEPVVSVATPRRGPSVEPEIVHPKADSGSTGSSRSRHGKGSSMDKLGFAKLFGNSASEGENVPSKLSSSFLGKRPSAQMDGRSQTPLPDSASKAGSIKGSSKSKSRKKALSLMVVEPISRTIRERTKNRSVTVDTSTTSKSKRREAELEQDVEVDTPAVTTAQPPSRSTVMESATFRPLKDVQRPEPSTISAKSVMNWFRLRSLKRGDTGTMPPPPTPPTFEMVDKPGRTPTMDSYVGGVGASSSSSVGQPPVQVIVTKPNSHASRPPSTTVKSRSPSESSGSKGIVNAVRTIAGVGTPSTPNTLRRGKFDNTSLRIHHGAVDQATVTSGAPPEVFAHVAKVLLGMGLEMQKETEFKYRCIRPKKRKWDGKDGLGRQASDAGSGYTAYTMVGSAASNGVDKRGLPVPSHPSFSGTGGILRGLLMRRQSSQVSTPAPPPVSSSGPSQPFETEPDSLLSDSSISHALPEALPAGTAVPEPIYGDRTDDQGDEVRFSVELTRIDRLEDTLSLDIRRLKGNLRSYKFLYDTLRDRCNFAR